MIYDVPSEEIDAPSQSFLDLRLFFAIVLGFTRAELPVVLLDLAVPASACPVQIGMIALYLPSSVGALRLPPVHQRKLTKLYSLRQRIQQTHAGLGTLHWFLLALEPLVDDWRPLGRSRNVPINLLVFSEGGGNYRPFSCISPVMALVLKKFGKVRLLDIKESFEEVLLDHDVDDPFIEDGEVLECLI